MKYHLAMIRNEVLTQATMWVNLQNMTLSERSHIQKVYGTGWGRMIWEKNLNGEEVFL